MVTHLRGAKIVSSPFVGGIDDDSRFGGRLQQVQTIFEDGALLGAVELFAERVTKGVF